MMTGWEFSQAPFQDVTWLMGETDKLYEKITAEHGIRKWEMTRDRIVALRKWEPALPLIKKNFESVLTEMDIFYVPAVIDPGPAYVFPQKDAYGHWRRARIKLGWDLLRKDAPAAKYEAIGMKKEFIGACWIGNQFAMLECILKHRAVLIVEGPFDILAVRLLCPDIPVLSTGNNALGQKHLDYLSMLGVKMIYLMFDQDAPDENGQSSGVDAMRRLKWKLEKFQHPFLRAESLVCPSKDPAAALTNFLAAQRLRSRLRIWMESL